MAFSRIVLDASVTIDWFLPETPGVAEYAGAVLKAIEAQDLLPIVPDLWHYEVGSVLMAAKRSKRISAKRLEIPIASTDGGIRTACRVHGVELWQPA